MLQIQRHQQSTEKVHIQSEMATVMLLAKLFI